MRRMAVMKVRWRRILLLLVIPTLCMICYLLCQRLSENQADEYVLSMFPMKTPQHQRPTSWETFKERNDRLRKACSDRLRRPATSASLVRFNNVLRVRSMAFCSLAKTGTTFWKRILYYMDRGLKGPLLSHDFGDIHSSTAYMLNHARFEKTRSYKNIVFVREPYLRLFSAYTNKLFVPRYSNWQHYARKAMEFSRKNASAHEKACSHNVTFAEFVHYFIHTELYEDSKSRTMQDEHFVPISQQCRFCRTSFDFIGRQETFAEDTLGILSQFNISNMLSFSDFDTNYKKYELSALINYTFDHEIKPISEKYHCMSKEEILRRLWKYLQMLDTLNAEELFPLSKKAISKVSAGDFYKLTMLAYNRSLRAPGTKSNKQSSFVEAYSTVPLTDRLLLRSVFRDDFLLFGYKSDHPLVFPEGDHFDLSPYRYFDVFDSFLNKKRRQ